MVGRSFRRSFRRVGGRSKVTIVPRDYRPGGTCAGLAKSKMSRTKVRNLCSKKKRVEKHGMTRKQTKTSRKNRNRKRKSSKGGFVRSGSVQQFVQAKGVQA